MLKKMAEDGQNKEKRNNSLVSLLCYKHSWLPSLALKVNNSFLILNKAKSFCDIINPLLTKFVGSKYWEKFT